MKALKPYHSVQSLCAMSMLHWNLFLEIAYMRTNSYAYCMHDCITDDLYYGSSTTTGSLVCNFQSREDGENTERLIAIRYIVVKWYSSQALPITRYWEHQNGRARDAWSILSREWYQHLFMLWPPFHCMKNYVFHVIGKLLAVKNTKMFPYILW